MIPHRREETEKRVQSGEWLVTSIDLHPRFSQHRPMFKLLIGVSLLLVTFAVAEEDKSPVLIFTKFRLTEQFWSEGAAAADFNQDGKVDLVYGPFWFAGPDFAKRTEYRPAIANFKRKAQNDSQETSPGFEGALGVNNAYSDCFLMFTHDFNNDRWPDILVIGFPGRETFWYENPQKQNAPWKQHLVLAIVDNESPGFTDVTGDGKPELVCCSEGFIGYAEADWKQPSAPWKFHAASPKGDYQRFTHGLGAGDINGDGRVDLLEKSGWWEQPKKPGDGRPWQKHEFNFGSGGAQMFAYDVNGDGRNDVITSLEAHGYGVAWFEQFHKEGTISFRQHLIVGRNPQDTRYGTAFSQPHALDLADVDGDGLKDLVTGKRFWAHGPAGDPEPNAAAVLYWFQLKRDGKGGAEFVPHLVDEDSGVGTQVTVARVSQKKNPDIIVGNKKGLFLFRNQAPKASRP